MLISFALCTHNEGEYVYNLLKQLYTYIESTKSDDEIVILDDLSDDMRTSEVLLEAAEKPYVSVYKRKFDGNFSDHKNYLNSLCRGDYIFQIDADETVNAFLLENLHTLLNANPLTDLYLIPRVNTVTGLTQEWIDKWHWNVNEKGYVMFPDYQTRLYRRKADILWEGKVHERIRGAKIWSALPEQEEYALYHHKSIERQVKQNELYDVINKEK